MNKIYHKEYVEQNYLENIYTLYLERDEVRNIDIVDKLGVARATVTHMLRNLEKKGYIKYGDDKIVRFTSKGRTLAVELYEKHIYLTQVFKHIGVDEKIAEIEACQIEHIISKDTFNKIKKYFEDKI
ncbi:metal-dependent transcriptional regulator [Streptococcus equi]|uniref:Iron-dependent repressor protein n=3 Tax=Streptococcus equi TaxID=1336 RepID=C0M6N6_STRE4|nr:metal-dependent transcriptional regulator [Streptococcus equi]HEN7857943.1 metal-dependent transcriptional regulator [Streptococcus agalactiae]ASB96873.1 transcriptional regulator [Streptococcus equi subsp. equi]MBT1195724.1 metal-dependent transcriptional regulator [Streptococcus equi subsp. equi]MBT1196436.1 metal-dependent transcriptional regulator [Streptococcus equi subsp. equi]MBT1199128.1 metal-dependent transcriptional regulator [Streptococcus equi subsp. equi]